jgi:hypothetical protein
METGLNEQEAVAQVAAEKERVARQAAEAKAQAAAAKAEAAAFRATATYVTGPWNIKANEVGIVNRDGGNLTFTIGIINKQTFTLPYQSIRKLSISTVDQLPRVTATRLLLVGVFALAWKKGQKDKFLQIDFVDNSNTELSIVFAKAIGCDIDTLHSKVLAARQEYLKSAGISPELPPPSPPPAKVGGAENIAARIEELAGLRDKGILTAEEFQAKKSELLARL